MYELSMLIKMCLFLKILNENIININNCIDFIKDWYYNEIVGRE
jgi:hypothetical protein